MRGEKNHNGETHCKLRVKFGGGGLANYNIIAVGYTYLKNRRCQRVIRHRKMIITQTLKIALCKRGGITDKRTDGRTD